jgi:hypothetical protein
MRFDNLTPQERRVLHRLGTDLEYFCRRALTIKLKSGGRGPFIWNRAQRYLHERIELQLARTGMVRMFIVKGRQQGISTYLSSRGYRKTTWHDGWNTFILSHHAVTTETLFQIVDGFHATCPPEITPSTVMNNNRRMKFENGSQYTVGTAGSGSIGRGDTNQFLHWSEAAFCDNISELLTGVFQTVADVPGTEKFIESTANGVGNFFHLGCMSAMSPDDPYELVFIPWYWQEEYTAQVPEGFQLTPEEEALRVQTGPDGQVYTLTDGQFQWRRNKITEFKKDGFGEKKFRQEYPFTVSEAFQASGSPLIDGDAVAKARKSRIKDTNAPVIMGVDPGPVNDPTAIVLRRGREIFHKEQHVGMGPMTMAGRCAKMIERYQVRKCFIDIAEGRGIVDRLHELGFPDIVTGIPFAMKPTDEERYVNKRAEMAGEFKDWIEDESGVSIPDDDDLEVEIGAHPEFKITSSGLRQLESKDNIKKNLGRSPNYFDAAILTFALPVAREASKHRFKKAKYRQNESGLAANRKRYKQPDPRPAVYDDEDSPEGWIRRDSNFRKRR